MLTYTQIYNFIPLFHKDNTKYTHTHTHTVLTIQYMYSCLLDHRSREYKICINCACQRTVQCVGKRICRRQKCSQAWRLPTQTRTQTATVRCQRYANSACDIVTCHVAVRSSYSNLDSTHGPASKLQSWGVND